MVWSFDRSIAGQSLHHKKDWPLSWSRRFLVGIRRGFVGVKGDDRQDDELGVVGDQLVGEDAVFLGIENGLAVLVHLNDHFAVELGVFFKLVGLRLVLQIAWADLHHFRTGDVPGFAELELLLGGVFQKLCKEGGLDEAAFALVGGGGADGDDVAAGGIAGELSLARSHVLFEAAFFSAAITAGAVAAVAPGAIAAVSSTAVSAAVTFAFE